MELVLIVLMVVWAVCGYFAYGFSFAYYQKEYPEIANESRDDDKKYALKFSFLGVVALIVAYVSGQTKYGRMYD